MNIKKHFKIYNGLPKEIYLLFVSIVINKMGSFIVPLMVLILTEKIGFSKQEAGLFSTIAYISQAPFIIIGGILVNKFGSKNIIVITQIAGSIFYFICGFIKPTFVLGILII